MKAFTSHDLTLVKWTLDTNNWVSFSLANHQVIVGVHLTSKTNKNSFKKLLQSRWSQIFNEMLSFLNYSLGKNVFSGDPSRNVFFSPDDKRNIK